jgi:hypothetical protein
MEMSICNPNYAGSKKDSPSSPTSKLHIYLYPSMGLNNNMGLPTTYVKLERLLLMVLKTLAIIGPSNKRTAKTTMATRASINAYSTRPCPFSCDLTSIIHLLQGIFCAEHTYISSQLYNERYLYSFIRVLSFLGYFVVQTHSGYWLIKPNPKFIHHPGSSNRPVWQFDMQRRTRLW